MQKYVPRAPAVSLADAMKHVSAPPPRRRPRRPAVSPKERTGKPCVHSLPGFHDNVYARMLAAKPKMDTVTRHVYPSTLLTKVGLISKEEVGARSPLKVFRGPRLWVSSASKALPKQAIGRLLSKYPFLKGLKPQGAFREQARQVLLNDMKELALAYRKYPPPVDRRVVCYVGKHAADTKTLVIDLGEAPELKELDLPTEIRSSQAGLHLAGFLVKYTYLYHKSSSD